MYKSFQAMLYAVGLTFTHGVSANTCDNMTLNDVLNAKNKADAVVDNSTKQAFVQSGAEGLASQTTSTNAGGSSTAGTLTNFYSLFSAAGLGGSIFGDSLVEDDENISLEYNQNLGNANAGVLKFKASFRRDPIIYEPLIDAIPEAERDSFRTANQGDLDLGDDSTFSLSYSFGQGDYFGKRTIQSFDEVYNNLISSVSAESAAINYQQLQQPFLAMLGKARNNRVSKNADARAFAQANNTTVDLLQSIQTDTKFKNYVLSKSDQASLCAHAKNFQQATAERSAAESAIIQQARFDALISNSPQLLFSISATERSNLAGPDEISAKLTFEWGLGNSMADLQRNSSGCVTDCASRYLQFIDTRKDSIDAGDRIKIELEYEDVDSYVFNGAMGDSLLNKPGSEKFIGSLGYGRILTTVGRKSRIDFELKYEDVEDDPDRNDRTIGTLTYSIGPLDTTGLTMPITFVYSDKSEYVQMNTDDKLSAHIGIKWDLGTN